MKHATLFLLGFAFAFPFRFVRPAQTQDPEPQVKPFTIEVRRDCYFNAGDEYTLKRLTVKDIEEMMR